MSRFHRPNIGSISSGLSPTKSPSPLAETFIYELRQQRPLHERDRVLLASLDDATEGGRAQRIAHNKAIPVLIEALNRYAPKGYYFGPSESDPTDFGYWPSEESSGRNAGSAEISARQRTAVEVAEEIAEQNIALPTIFDPPTPSEVHSVAEATGSGWSNPINCDSNALIAGKPQC